MELHIVNSFIASPAIVITAVMKEFHFDLFWFIWLFKMDFNAYSSAYTAVLAKLNVAFWYHSKFCRELLFFFIPFNLSFFKLDLQTLKCTQMSTCFQYLK